MFTFGLILCTLIYIMLLEPHYGKYQALKVQVPNKALGFERMRDQAQTVMPILDQQSRNQSSNASLSGQSTASIVTQIESTLTRFQSGKQVKRIQPGKDGEVRLWFDGVHFNPWLQWADGLHRQGIEVVSFKAQRSQDNQVNIQVTVSRQSGG